MMMRDQFRIFADHILAQAFGCRDVIVTRQSVTATHTEPPAILGFGVFEFDILALVTAAVTVIVTAAFELLDALMADPGRLLNRQELLRAIWGDSAYRDPRAIDVHIRHLREKLEPEPEKPKYILTVRGAGYRLRGP